MTMTKLVSVKVPLKIFRAMPGAHKGRSRFIVSALAEKISRREPVKWEPKTETGRKLAAILEKGKKERGPALSEIEFEQELKERRGRNF